jgi:L-threonylcarbamoyladenylate synthase
VKFIEQAAAVVKNGGIIAYPTEAVFGLGCDPFNEESVQRLLSIKKRPTQKGLIVIAASWEIIAPLVQPVEPTALAHAQSTWPGPFTWVFPASNKAPVWICGSHHTIAVRVTAHPIARTLCNALNAPLLSTSANISTHPPLRDMHSVLRVFRDQIDYILPGEVGSSTQPTSIRDVITGNIFRQ